MSARTIARIVIAAGGHVYYTRPNMTMREMALPAGVSITGQTPR